MLQHIVPLHFSKMGTGQGVATIPWVSTDFADIGTTLLNQGQLGNLWYDAFGNRFMVKKAASAFTIGQTSCLAAPGTDTAAAGTTTQVINLTTGALTANAEVGNFVYETEIGNGGTGATKSDALKLIKANAAGTLTVSLTDTKRSNLQIDADAYVTAPVATDHLTIIRPFSVVPTPTAQAATAFCQGIAVQAITSGDFGLFQIGGIALVLYASTTAAVANAPCAFSGATAGAVTGAAAWTAGNTPGFFLAAQTVAGLAPLGLTFSEGA
jgi:hypothetical protein